MRLYRRHWYELGLIPAALALIWLAISWNGIGWPQRLVTLNFVAMLLHQFEEYGWPGGFPALANGVIFKSSKPDRYPLSAWTAWINNFCLAYVMYGIAALFPSVAWLGIAGSLLGFGQVWAHGFMENRALKSFYNPGLVTAIFMFLPIGAAYLWIGQTSGFFSVWDWGFGVVYLAVFMGIFQWWSFQYMPNENSPYPFSPEEVARFDAPAKVLRLTGTKV
jgi:hypothetical protein